MRDPSVRLLVDFFRNKGLQALKEEDRREDWYPDWIDYQAKHQLYASLLSPRRYSSLDHSFNFLKLTRFLEVFAYFSPAHRLAEAPAFQNVRKIRTLGIRSAFVGAFDVKGHPLPEDDILSQGREVNGGGDAATLIAVGKCLSIIAYAQLVAENCLAAKASSWIVSVIFHGLIEDLSAEALKLSAMFVPGSAQRALLRRVVRVPRTTSAQFAAVSELIKARYG